MERNQEGHLDVSYKHAQTCQPSLFLMGDLHRLSYLSLSLTNNSCGAIHEIVWLTCSLYTTVTPLCYYFHVKAYFQLLKVNQEGRNYLLLPRHINLWSFEVLSMGCSYTLAGFRNLDISIRDQYPFALRDTFHKSKQTLYLDTQNVLRNVTFSNVSC